MISASQLYDFVHCPMRVYLDAHGDPARRDKPSAFTQMLWKQGVAHEERMVPTLGVTADITRFPEAQREAETLAAMKRGEALIYGGRISAGRLVGVPDLLERRTQGYIPGDLKSGSGLDGDEDDGKLKRHYAYQLAHYARILEDMGLSDGSRESFIIDREGTRTTYPMNAAQGVKTPATWWDAYHGALDEVEALVAGTPSRGAISSKCKQCEWKSHCREELEAADDLTLIPELGRSKRNAIAEIIPTMRELAAIDPEDFIKVKKTVFKGIGPDTLRTFHARAVLLTTRDATPYIKEAVSLPERAREVFFDIEDDPLTGMCYLHGFVERPHGNPRDERYVPFFAVGESAADERAAFEEAWAYLQARRTDSAIYYYSSYEKGAYRRLAKRHPAVCSVEDVEGLFAEAGMVDLYSSVVKTKTEWPLNDHSIKTIASYLGFKWRDTNPSGAASIEWYHSFKDAANPLEKARIKQRILDYNEDDCRATGVVLGGIRRLPVR